MILKIKKRIDKDLILIIGVILLIGFFTLFSVSASSALEHHGSTYHFLLHQFFYGLMPGIFLGLLVFVFRLKRIKKLSFYFFLANLILLILVFFPFFGSERGGARRWLSFGSFSFQPAELLKISLPLYLAAWFSAKKKKKSFKTLISFFLILSPVAILLILQPDFSSLLILLSIAGLMYFIADTPIWHSILILASFCAGGLTLIVFKPYRMKRFLVFLNPKTDPLGIGYQLKQCLIAIGSGGFWGKGLGLSVQKFGLIPSVKTDSIFAVFAEETGFIGPLILISLFLFFLLKIVLLAKNSRDKFAKYLCIALGAELVAQVFLNMGAMLAILPLTGTSFPFFSYGGTHLVIELVMVALLLEISRYA